MSHHSLETYHDAVVKQMGQQRVHGFSRFYLVPGLGHGVGAFQPAWDSLKALEHWVEDGSPPANVVVKDVSPDNAGRTRPLCEIGSWPVYLGGDVRAASSFRCGDHVAQASAK